MLRGSGVKQKGADDITPVSRSENVITVMERGNKTLVANIKSLSLEVQCLVKKKQRENCISETQVCLKLGK